MPDGYRMGQVASDNVYERTGLRIDPRILTAQLQHETGNFASISDELKAVHNWSGMSTNEDTGVARPAEEGGYYRTYDSDDEFVEDWSKTIAARASYWKSQGGGDINDPSTFVDMLIAEPGWHYFDDNKDPGGANYKASVAAFMGIDAPDIIDSAVQHVGPWGVTQSYLLPNIPDPKKAASFWDEFTDKFSNQFLDQGSVSAIRTAYYNFINRDSMAELALNEYKPSQEDIELVQQGLEGDTIAQQYVLANAHNRATLLSLLAMKQEDRARAARVDEMEYGLSSVGSVLGSVLDPTLLLAFVPYANLGVIANVASKVGKVRAALSFAGKLLDSSKAARIAVSSMSAMAGAGIDRFGAERWGGWKPDYATSMAFAGLLGAFGGALRKLPNNHIVADLKNVNDNATNNAVHIAVGANPPLEAKHNLQNALNEDMLHDFAQEGSDIDLHYAEKAAKAAAEKAELEREPDVAQEGAGLTDVLGFGTKVVEPSKDTKGLKNGNKNASDLSFPDQIYRPDAPVSPTEVARSLQAVAETNFYDLIEPNSITDTLIKNGQIFVLSTANAQKWAKRYGVTLDPKAKAFSIPGMGVSVLLRDKINKRNLTGVVMHEAGVHMALRSMIRPDLFQEILDIVKDRMKNSTNKEWLRATKNATSPEEALAYWVEQMGNRHKLDSVIKRVRRGVEEWLDPNFDQDKWIADTVAGALKRYAAKDADANKVLKLILDPGRPLKSRQWAAAIKATRSTNPEIIFKYWITHNPNKNSALYKEIKKQAEAYFNRSVSEEDLQKFAISKYFHSDLHNAGPVYKKGKNTNAEANLNKELDDEQFVKYTANRAREEADNVIGQLDSLLKRNAEEFLAKENPVQTLPDGSHIINNVVYSPKNVVGNAIADEIEYSKYIDKGTIFDAVSDRGVSSKRRQGHFGAFGLWMEHSRFVGNIFGILVNSHSPKAQIAAKTLFYDPRMEGSHVDFMPTEGIKQFLLDRWNRQYMDFVDKRASYVSDNFGIYRRNVHRNNCIKAVDEQIIKCYNARAREDIATVKEFPKEIQEMAKMLEDLNEDVWAQLRKNSEQLGGRKGLGSLLNHNEPIEAKEFYRITDEFKRDQFMTRNFSSFEEAEEALAEYARRFMDQEAETKYWIDLKKYEFEQKKKKWDGKGEKPQWVEPTAEEIEEHLEKAAKDWAHGRVDQNMSRLTFDQMHVSQMTDTLKHRLPMDTSGVMKLKNGVDFSFDKDLRNYDIDTFLPQIFNRLSGEAALRATIGDSKAQKAFYDAIAQETAKASAVRNGDRELEALQMGLHKILGIGSYNLHDQKLADCFSNTIRSLNYANVGGNMTAAQLGEYGGAIAYGGFKVLADNIPIIKNLAQAFRNGKQGQALIEDVTRKLYAEDIATRNFDVTYSTDSRCYRELFDKVSEESPQPTRLAKVADGVNRNIKRAALLTSTVNFMPKLTNMMVQTMRRSAVEDSLKWAAGKEFGGLSTRNPFSKKKLAAVGIHTQKDIDAFRANIKKYLVDGKGDTDTWYAEDPMGFMRWKRWVDQQSMRGIQQNSIGNMTPFKEKHRLFFQFKDFTMKAMNQQFMRALSSHERDDMMAALYSYATNTVSYMGLTYLRAYAYYPHDEKKRQEYLNKNANWQKVALSGFFRMSLTAPASFASDAWEVYSGQSMYRTTVDNTNNYRSADDSWDKRIADAANQAPAIGYAGRAFEAAKSVKNISSGQGTTKDIDNFLKAIPLGQWIGITYAGSLLKPSTGLPEKRKTKKVPKAKKKTTSGKQKDIVSLLKG